MSLPDDDSAQASASHRQKRERSMRYPGMSLAESLKLCESMDTKGLDGLSAPEIASALGYKNIKTNTFSASLSAARQFGLLNLTSAGYELTSLAREILHPVDLAEIPRLHRQALVKPPLYSELVDRFTNKRVPEIEILGNILYHNHQITSSAKRTAAEAFCESARFAGVLGPDQILRIGNGPAAAAAPVAPAEPQPVRAEIPVQAPPIAAPRAPSYAQERGVRLDLTLWGSDAGKTIRLRTPESISPESFERFIQAFRLLVRIRTESDDELDDPDLL